MSMIFQSYALWPHMTVTENIVYGLRLRKMDRDTIAKKLAAILATTKLEALAQRYPGELSGGQQQRVLIARALVSEPVLLVLDEPIAGVDLEAQRLFRDSLMHLVERHHTAILLVSHELGAVADDLDRVVVMKQRILFDGVPGDLAATGVSLGVHAEDLPQWLEELGT
jgi:iron(III) transport system ATP-binding protein